MSDGCKLVATLRSQLSVDGGKKISVCLLPQQLRPHEVVLDVGSLADLDGDAETCVVISCRFGVGEVGGESVDMVKNV